MSTDSTTENDWKRTFDMFKLEYELAAQRYENIYKAIWQNFSYMAVLAAGILTFGSKNGSFRWNEILSIALLPLVFWFLATYIPAEILSTVSRMLAKFKIPCGG